MNGSGFQFQEAPNFTRYSKATFMLKKIQLMEKPQDMTELSTNYVTFTVSLIKTGLMFETEFEN
jgi:hypothetical protein